MAAKALNKKNLLVLGPDRLADLLMEVTKGRADLQRRLRLELSAHQGPEDVARDIRKRYASLRQAKGYLSRKTHRTFAKEIRSLIALIEGLAPVDPALAFDLLWELLHLGPGVLDRTDDRAGLLAEVWGEAMTALSRLAPHLTLPPPTLAETLFGALEHDARGLFAGGVRALAPALGPQGLAHLDGLAATAPARTGTARHHQLAAIRRDIADAQGNVDAFVANLSAKQLTTPAIAAEVATRLLAAHRALEALAILQNAPADPALVPIHVACLEALNRTEDLKAFLWQSFRARPDADILRRYLRLLPDFDDIEAEDEARALARDHADRNAALQFFLDWRDPAMAAALVLARPDALNGDDPGPLIRAADTLDSGHPLASVLLRRTVILASLRRGRPEDIRRAADQLLACAATDAPIADYGDAPDHLSFVTRLRRTHGRRRSLWTKVS
ncbi:DUF6880 family protein [Falsirhodobacter sp. 20TX0035]|uniref:DUF6880 family protein n=1 Tax=Falsirhodobacter sp. 20TX0035 TaxID=3022019 RepID=UPI002330C7CF|nr:DUF6880 family protein [Falsirhodobacter sp. 20TX0035]MDB6455214.1 hypothetical protein [Falsirhodobacter sp. 20TX0035]